MICSFDKFLQRKLEWNRSTIGDFDQLFVRKARGRYGNLAIADLQ